MGFPPRRHRVVAALLVVVFSLSGAWLVPAAAAQQHVELPADSLHYRSLGDVLVDLQASTGIDLVYESSLIRQKWVRMPETMNGPPERMLHDLLRGTGLYSYRLSSGTYAIKAIDADAPAMGGLSGAVHDALTGEPIPDAHVILLADASQGTTTDRSGHFQFHALHPGPYLVRITHLGYAIDDAAVQIDPAQQVNLQIDLHPRLIPFTTPIIVEGLQPPPPEPHLNDTWSPNELPPATGLGTRDALRDLASIPGVRTGDATADLHIQGGEAGEHQFRLDGVPVFEPVHLRGLLGAFNPFALERIVVHKAGFGAAEGSQIAGVIDAEHALPPPGAPFFDLQVDPLSLNARLNLTTPLNAPLRAQFMTAARTSIWSLYQPNALDSLLRSWNEPDPFLLRASLLAAQEQLGIDLGQIVLPDSSFAIPHDRPELGFTDLHAAARFRFDGGRSLHASFYGSDNHLSARRFFASPDSIYRSNDVYDWGNLNGQIRYADVIGTSAFWTLRLRANRYSLSHGYLTINDTNAIPIPGGFIIPTELTPVDDGNRIRELALESALDLERGPHLARLGTEWIRTAHRFTIDDVVLRPITNASDDWRMASFAEVQSQLSTRLQTTGGARLTYLNNQRRVYAEPRFEIRYDAVGSATHGFSARLAAGLYRQFVNQFDVSSISPSALLPGVRFWMPVDATVTPAKAYHFAGEALWRLNPPWALRLEGYYKAQPHILAIDYPTLFTHTDTTATIQDTFLRASRGSAYGSALSLERVTYHLRLAARYEYNIAEREYAFQDSVRLEPAPWSQPHRLDLALDARPLPGLVATARWRGGWGRTWAYRRAYYDFLATSPGAQPRYGCEDDRTTCEVDFTRPATHDLPPFVQLDLGVAYTLPFEVATLQLRLDVLNALDRENVADWSILAETDDEGELAYQARTPRATLPRTISMAARLRW